MTDFGDLEPGDVFALGDADPEATARIFLLLLQLVTRDANRPDFDELHPFERAAYVFAFARLLARLKRERGDLMGGVWLDGRTGGYLNLLDVLTAGGVSCSGYSGWTTRSRSSGGYEGLWGVVCHHTASNTTPANDLNYMVNADDGPISTGLLDRTGHFTVIAAGAANHAGKGGGTSDGGGQPWHTTRGTIPGNDANRWALGIEAANAGTGAEPWPGAQQDAYVKMVRALCNAYALDPGRDVRSHAEWTPPRKIDPKGPSRWSTNNTQPWAMDLFRAEVGQLPAPTPTEDNVLTIFTVDGAGAAFLGFTWDGLGQQIEWLDTQAKLDTYRSHHCPELHIGLADCRNLYLLGPVPAGDHKHNWTRADFRGVIDTA